MLRCFLGFELTEGCRNALRQWLEPLHRKLAGEYDWPVRLIHPDNWHATLLFFGGLTGKERETIWSKVEEQAREGQWGEEQGLEGQEYEGQEYEGLGQGLSFDWQRVSLWPSSRRPNLVCLEARRYDAAADWPLTHLLDTEPFSKGETGHLMRYRPHITVMRFRKGKKRSFAREWRAIEEELPKLDARSVRFDRLSFFLSTLSQEQPVYPREHTIGLHPSLPEGRD